MENQISYNRAIDLYNAENYEESIEIAMPFVNCDERAKFLLVVGAALSNLNRTQEALPYLEEVIHLLPTSDFATNALYSAYMELGLLNDAFDELERFLRVRDSSSYYETIIGYATAVGYNFDTGSAEELLEEVKTDIRQGSKIIWPDLRQRILFALQK